MPNFFIAYDLASADDSHDAVRAAVGSLGPSRELQRSLFYVNSYFSPTQVYDIVMASMDPGDCLAVIDAPACIVTNWDRPPVAELNGVWLKQSRSDVRR